MTCYLKKNHPSKTRIAGGVAILIPETIRSMEIGGFENLKETICVELRTADEKTVRVMTTYLHPGEKMQRGHLKNLVKDSKNCDLVIAAGDFNAKIGSTTKPDCGVGSYDLGNRN